MQLKRTRSVVMIVALLTTVLILVVGVTSLQSQQRRPKATFHRIAFTAPDTLSHPAPRSYEVEVEDLARGEVTTYVPDEFYWAYGRLDPNLGQMPDSHVVFVPLEKLKNYKLRVQGISADGHAGPWSPWSILFEHKWSAATPDS